jgi:hypothetical protein
MKRRYFLIILAVILSLFVIQYVNSQSNAVIELYSDGSWEWVVTPSPQIVTTTPLASQTPWVVTATLPAVSVTPTQETTLPPPQPTMTPTPSPTIVPTITPTQVPKCWGTTIANLNVRKVPGGEWLGTIPAGDTLTLEAKWLHQGEWWYQHYWLPEQAGWSHSGWINISPDADCSQLEDVTPPPIYVAALLWHTVPGFNIENARISHQILATENIGFGYKTYASMEYCVETLENGGTCIYRHPNQDCPQNIGSADPVQSAQEFFAVRGEYACDVLNGYAKAWYEPTNECWFGSSLNDREVSAIYWWRDWMDEYLNIADAYGCPQLVLPTFGPGHGEPLHYRIWHDVLNRLAMNGGLVGEHAYQPYLNNEGNYDLCPCDPYLACRHRLNEEYRQAEGVDINVAITEAARGWGGEPVSVDDFVCWFEEVRHDEYLHSVSLWVLGQHLNWPNANLDDFVIPISLQVSP